MGQDESKHGTLLLVEGADGSGKTSVTRAIRFLANHEALLVYERMVGSAWVYDQWFQRPPTRRYFEELRKLNEIYDVKQIVCYATPADIMRRVDSSGEFDYTLHELEKIQDLFRKWHRVCMEEGIPSLLLHTSDGIGLKASAKVALDWIHA